MQTKNGENFSRFCWGKPLLYKKATRSGAGGNEAKIVDDDLWLVPHMKLRRTQSNLEDDIDDDDECEDDGTRESDTESGGSIKIPAVVKGELTSEIFFSYMWSNKYKKLFRA